MLGTPHTSECGVHHECSEASGVLPVSHSCSQIFRTHGKEFLFLELKEVSSQTQTTSKHQSEALHVPLLDLRLSPVHVWCNRPSYSSSFPFLTFTQIANLFCLQTNLHVGAWWSAMKPTLFYSSVLQRIFQFFLPTILPLHLFPTHRVSPT